MGTMKTILVSLISLLLITKTAGIQPHHKQLETLHKTTQKGPRYITRTQLLIRRLAESTGNSAVLCCQASSLYSFEACIQHIYKMCTKSDKIEDGQTVLKNPDEEKENELLYEMLSGLETMCKIKGVADNDCVTWLLDYFKI